MLGRSFCCTAATSTSGDAVLMIPSCEVCVCVCVCIVHCVWWGGGGGGGGMRKIVHHQQRRCKYMYNICLTEYA